MKNEIEDPSGCMLGTQKLRWDNILLKRKLRSAWMAIWALCAVTFLALGFAAMVAGGAR